MGNLNNAFDVADSQLGIPKILDAEGKINVDMSVFQHKSDFLCVFVSVYLCV